ncbi:MAG: excinuclease ABC subunit UvrA [Pirellulales bacterium]
MPTIPAKHRVSPSALQAIRVRGARTHNLVSVDLDLPRHKLIVFCGVSGSGKTSMALDTLYAEGQRRYIESFSAYTRQFLAQLDKPDADSIDGIPPAVAVTHRNTSRSNRATIGTTTEVADHLRLLFARVGTVICPECDCEVRSDSVDSIVDQLQRFPTGTRAMVGFAETVPEENKIAGWLAQFTEAGYVRGVWQNQTVTVSITPELARDLHSGEPFIPLIDRVIIGQTSRERVAESVETALLTGNGACVVLTNKRCQEPLPYLEIHTKPNQPGEMVPDTLLLHVFSRHVRCPSCHREFAEPQPDLFHFNSPLGACPTCEGFGSVVETDMNLVIPDRTKSLRDGAVAPWNTPAYAHELEELLALAADYHLPVDVPFEQLTPEQVRLVIEGIPVRKFGGLNGFFRWLERRKYKMHLRVFLSRWRTYRVCPDCHGTRLNPEALAVQVAHQNFANVCAMKVDDSLRFFDRLATSGATGSASESTGTASGTLNPAPMLTEHQRQIARIPLDQIRHRLRYLVDVGVGYLSLDRRLRTLSDGEAQRVAMTATLGSNLVDMLYVLDEPSVGLHPADVPRLTQAISRLRDRGNTVIAVEHEEQIIRAADQVVEFGPGAGIEGGRVTFQGTPQEMERTEGNRTGDWLAGRRMLAHSGTRRTPTHGRVTLIGARANNLQNLTVDFPLGLLCLVTGVSGAGKSSLVRHTLYPALASRLNKSNDAGCRIQRAGKVNQQSAISNQQFSAPSPKPPAPNPSPTEILGGGQLEDVVFVDQTPIGRSPRSNPVTYIKAFDPIRTLFADQPEAKSRGFTASHFSFNVAGGRCEACQGAGYLQVDMQFMADIFMRCPECGGRRYRREVLDVKYRGRDIAEILDLTALEAFRFFRGQKKLQARLKSLLDVGLDYLRLGQPANTLSGGEAQRLKLAEQLAVRRHGRTLFLLDEPTTGLHFSDIVKLVDCFDALIEVGHSIIVVEHNLQLMRVADWIIDLGPGAADEGGRVVTQGTPEEVAKCEESATGRALAT